MTRIFDVLKPLLNLENVNIFCWSDSEVELCWLKGNHKNWKSWVENRVVKCRKVVQKERWFHVCGKDNPADVPTRWSSFDSSLGGNWFHGPQFLREDGFVSESSFVVNKVDIGKGILSEVKKKKIEEVCGDVVLQGLGGDMINETVECLLTTEEKQDVELRIAIGNVINIERYNDLNKLLRMTCYVMRFVNNLKGHLKSCKTAIVMGSAPTLEEWTFATNL